MLGLRFSAWRLETEFGRQIEWLRLVLQQDVQQLDFPGLVPKMTEKGLILQQQMSRDSGDRPIRREAIAKAQHSAGSGGERNTGSVGTTAGAFKTSASHSPSGRVRFFNVSSPASPLQALRIPKGVATVGH